MADDFSTVQSDDPALTIAGQLRVAGFEDAHEIGRGGFGIVYRCTQVELDRVVAVKVLTAPLADNRSRFVREQRAMAKLTGHPNIVVVLQVGETRGELPYLVMPFCSQGCVHDQVAKHGPLPFGQALRMGVGIADALGSAHDEGIVHRDVKPANVLLTDFGAHALTDFGISHMADSFKTATGMFTGSPAFTAPEVILGHEAGPPADVYGLGATLFCALAGNSAFERRDGEQIVAQLLRIATEPPPDLREHGIAGEVASLVGQAMSRDPDQRPSAREFGQDLQRLLATSGSGADDATDTSMSPSARPAQRTAPLASVRPTCGNLPAQLAGFVGRSAELSNLRGLLSTSRLVTLVGVGGVGKTSLALQAARDEMASFADGVWWVELAQLRDGSLLTEQVATAVGVRDQAGRQLTDVLIEVLGDRRTLLVLDNCEQLVDDVAHLVEALLHACPRLQILATSREILRIGGEAIVALAPLAYPDSGAATDVTTLADFDAVALFAECARRAQPRFTLTEHNAAAVAQICARLDGLPLAIELATARLRMMSLAQIADRLSDRFALLTRGKRGAPTRQQTLTWCIEWSYDRCTAEEQRLWTRLSVFAGSFDIDAAQHVCGDDKSYQDDLVDDVSGLIDKSIIVQTEVDGAMRFRLLETMREFAKARVDSPEEYRRLQRRHVDWYQRVVADASAEWSSPRQVEWLNRLTGEMPNLREALTFALTDSPAVALEMATFLRQIWMARGMLGEALRWLDAALAANPVEASAARVTALGAAALVAVWQADVATASSRVAEAREQVDGVSDPVVLGLIDFVDGFASMLRGEFDRARACFEEAAATPGDFEVPCGAMMLLGWVLEIVGDADGALLWLEKALALTDVQGELVMRSRALSSLSVGYWRLGDFARAESLMRDGLLLAQRIGDPWMGAQCLEGLAWIAEAVADPGRAATLMAAASAVSRSSGAGSPTFANTGDFHEECVARVRDQLQPAEFQAASIAGSAMNLTQAAKFALGTISGKTARQG